MGPQIDTMFRSPGATIHASERSNVAAAHPAATGILNSVSQQATGGAPQRNKDIITMDISSGEEYDKFKHSCPCTVILFTSQSCPPCVHLHPIFESLAKRYREKEHETHRRIRFAKVESSPSSAHLMQQQSISATPTIRIFSFGNMISEVKGANPSALETSIENALRTTYIPHAHSKIASPSSIIPASAIVHKVIPNLMSAQQKLDDTVAKHKASSFSQKADLQDARSSLTRILIPWIRNVVATGKQGGMNERDCLSWVKSARQCIGILPYADLFPIVDFVRIATLDPKQSTILAASEGHSLVDDICSMALSHIDRVAENKPTLLVTYRLAGNVLALEDRRLSKQITHMSSLLVSGVLCQDDSVRAAAINATFNWSRVLAGQRSSFVLSQSDIEQNSEENVELICALLECIDKERDIERRKFGLWFLCQLTDSSIVHRASASLTLLLYCAPDWDTTIMPLLEVVEAPNKLEKKLKDISLVDLADQTTSSKHADVSRLLEVALQLSQV